MAGLEELLQAKLGSTCLWDLAPRRVPVLANAPTPLGEPVVECKLLIKHSLPSYQLDRLKTILVFYSCFSSHHFSACDRVARLHSGLRPSPVDPQHPQRVHGPLQHRHELLQRPQPNHIAKETNSSISFSSFIQQTFINRLPRWWTSQSNSQRHLHVLHHLVLATEASSSTTSCCCF